MTFRRFCRILAAPVTVLFVLVSLPIGAAQAALVTTDEIIAGMSAGEDRARVHEFLERADVRRHMVDLGVDPAEAAQRIAAMSDEEVRAIAGRLDEAPAGEGAVGVLIGAALIVFLVLLFTDIIGATDVFGFDD
jgi:hypothetical protein